VKNLIQNDSTLRKIQPGNDKSTITVRISKELEYEIRNLASKLGVQPYVIRNAALALGLDIIKNNSSMAEPLLKHIEKRLRNLDTSLVMPQV